MSADIDIQPGLFFGQWALVAGGLGLSALGVAILWSILEWRLHGRALEAEVIGVRRRGGAFFSVYRYALPTGESHEATSIQGSGSLDDRYEGRRVRILVKPERPDEARESHSPAAWAMGIVTLLGGAWLSYDAVTSWPHALITWAILAALSGWIFRVIRRRLMPLFAKLRAQAANSGWKGIPLESAETIAAPTPRIQVSNSISRRAGPILCVAGLVSLAVAAIPAYRLVQLRSSQHAVGTVLRLEQNHFNNNRYNWFPYVEFIAADGARVQFLDRAGGNPSPYHVGDQVKVMYPASAPSNAMVDRGGHNWEPVIALVLLGGTLIGIGLLGGGNRNTNDPENTRRQTVPRA